MSVYQHDIACECMACLVHREELAGRVAALRETQPRPGTLRAIEQRYGRPSDGPRVPS